MIQPAGVEDIQQIVPMAQDVFNESDASLLQREFETLLESDNDLLLVAKEKEEVIAFLHMAMRFEYIEGATESPVAYLEGIYVKPSFRKQGVATSLVEEAEQWGAQNGATAFASDALLDNQASIAFHQQIGYKIVSKTVHFLKPAKKERSI